MKFVALNSENVFASKFIIYSLWLYSLYSDRGRSG